MASILAFPLALSLWWVASISAAIVWTWNRLLSRHADGKTAQSVGKLTWPGQHKSLMISASDWVTCSKSLTIAESHSTLSICPTQLTPLWPSVQLSTVNHELAEKNAGLSQREPVSYFIYFFFIGAPALKYLRLPSRQRVCQNSTYGLQLSSICLTFIFLTVKLLKDWEGEGQARAREREKCMFIYIYIAYRTTDKTAALKRWKKDREKERWRRKAKHDWRRKSEANETAISSYFDYIRIF